MKEYPKIIIFYHANCPDGFGARFAAELKLGSKARYVPITHSERKTVVFEELKHKYEKVYFIDISPEDKNDLDILYKEYGKNLLILDHHKSAKEELGEHICFSFDNNHSGAYLSWEHFWGLPINKLILHIEDRDLHKFKLKNTEEILKVLDTKQRTFNEWLNFSQKFQNVNENFSSIIEGGELLKEYSNTLVSETIKRSLHHINIQGHIVPAVNSSIFMNEISNRLAEIGKFGVCYYFNGENYIFSLRSVEGGMDVANIAKAVTQSGGGHKHAAGFHQKNAPIIVESK